MQSNDHYFLLATRQCGKQITIYAANQIKAFGLLQLLPEQYAQMTTPQVRDFAKNKAKETAALETASFSSIKYWR